MNEKEEKELLKQAMSLLGKRTSEKKAATARENGKRGGRPRKVQEESAQRDSD